MKAYKVYDREHNKFHLGGMDKNNLSNKKEGGKLWKKKQDVIAFLMQFVEFNDAGTVWISHIPPDWDIIELELTRNGCYHAIDFIIPLAQRKVIEREAYLKEFDEMGKKNQAIALKAKSLDEIEEYKRLKQKYEPLEGYL